jgi:hypothetical protein
VLDELHELDLLEHLGLGGLVQLLLVNNLDRHLLASEHVAGQLDHSIVALAYTVHKAMVREQFQCFGSGSGVNPDSIGSENSDSGRQTDPKRKREKISCLEVLEVLFGATGFSCG